MNITQTKIDELDIKVSLTITKEDYAQTEKKKLAERKRTAEFKGFRKGMVPMQLIQRVYGEQALVEAVNASVSKGLNDFITENNLKLIGEPLTSEDQPEIEWTSGNDFTFLFDLATAKELDFEVSESDKIAYYDIQASEAGKAEMKQNLLRQFGSLQDGESAGEQDYVIADLSQGETKIEDSYLAVRNISGEAHNSFLGAKAGDEFDINVNEAFADEADRASTLHVEKDELANIDPHYHVTVKTVKTFVSAEANQETFDKIYGEDKVHNEAEFDAAVEARLVDNYRQESEYRFSKDLKAALMEKAAIELPEAFLKRWLFQINEGKFTMEQIEKEFPAFLVDYKWRMIKEYLFGKYELKIEENEVHEAAEAYVSYQYAMYGMANVPENLIHDAAHSVLADEHQARHIYENVEEQKVISAVKEKVALDHKSVTVEQFRELK